MSSASDCVLLHGDGFRDKLFHLDTTMATATTSLGFRIDVSLSCPVRPLLPTMLFVSIARSRQLPSILRSVQDLILFRLPLYPSEDFAKLNEHDYFIYRLGGVNGASLELLPRPPTNFRDEDVGLLRRGDGRYTVAALHATSKRDMYELQRFDSATKVWSSDERQWAGPRGAELYCPKPFRGITFDNKPGMEPCLRFVQLEPNAVLIPPPGDEDEDDDEEAEFPDWAMRDWKVTTWSNSKMTTSWNDWKIDCTIQASKTNISSKLKYKMTQYGLLSSSVQGVPGRAFQNLLVSFPAPGMDENVVYIQAKAKFMDTKVFVLRLDMKENVLLGAVEFATESIPGDGAVYFPCNLSRYIDPYARTLFPEDDDSWEMSKYEGTETRQLPRLQICLADAIGVEIAS
ncbi:hypothetical protein HU200_018572 [Digitaria exilis]|uniref:DUF1618 domain-containing protein n=1 Tax=Digitaria exilis TaxID=1010633 RepID=A0A835F4S0_9POAL|nr:hypothetical protein HU200_018572 [Digitaria exilis]